MATTSTPTSTTHPSSSLSLRQSLLLAQAVNALGTSSWDAISKLVIASPFVHQSTTTTTTPTIPDELTHAQGCQKAWERLAKEAEVGDEIGYAFWCGARPLRKIVRKLFSALLHTTHAAITASLAREAQCKKEIQSIRSGHKKDQIIADLSPRTKERYLKTLQEQAKDESEQEDEEETKKTTKKEEESETGRSGDGKSTHKSQVVKKEDAEMKGEDEEEEGGGEGEGEGEENAVEGEQSDDSTGKTKKRPVGRPRGSQANVAATSTTTNAAPTSRKSTRAQRKANTTTIYEGSPEPNAAEGEEEVKGDEQTPALEEEDDENEEGDDEGDEEAGSTRSTRKGTSRKSKGAAAAAAAAAAGIKRSRRKTSEIAASPGPSEEHRSRKRVKAENEVESSSDTKAFRKSMNMLLDNLTNEGFTNPFKDPVLKRDAKTYYSAIKRPLSIQEIRKKLRSPDGYTHASQVARDIALVCANARQFNPSANKDPDDLAGQAEQTWRKMEELMQLHMSNNS
ncbi:BQ2448_6303 [Microbotryum intermedium]|uniref:BQ2448_6303 protein n=1 Tax=Microbotryum intermedium TaxID=269621 RepID=A0A238FPD8_9BASI|nr:BQ2448_6303 [Microbotryum intermedium]